MTLTGGKGRDRRIFLHIGTHKTGTTSFQQSLRANAEPLAERGIGTVGEAFTARI